MSSRPRAVAAWSIGADAAPGSERFRLLILGAIAAFAIVLRFAHLDWGLRHPVHYDETVFVENAQRMLDQGDADHRYYYYPGLFFYLLMPVIGVFGDGTPPGPASFLAARGMVAAFGALNVVLLYRLGREMVGPRAGMVAALLLAVSPVAIEQAHTVHTDVVLQTFGLVALLAFRRVSGRLRGDIVSGGALGLAGAVKFSGVFLVPAYLVARALAPGRRLAGLAAAGATALAVFAVCSPYAVLRAPDFLAGVRTQIAFHDREETAAGTPYLAMAKSYAAVWPKAVGWPAALMALYGLVRARREPRAWAPLLVLAVATLAVMGTSRLRFDRHMLPSLGIPILLAVLGLASMGSRRPRLAALLGVGMVAVPLWGSVEFLGAIGAPSTRDQALDWIGAHVPDGRRVLTSVERFGLDRGKVEVLSSGPLRPDQRLQALHFDYVVVGTEDAPLALEGLKLEYHARAANRFSGTDVRVFSVPPPLRPRYRAVEPRPEALRASVHDDSVVRAVDGRLDTSWDSRRPQRAGDWIEARWAQAVRVARIEIRLDADPRREGRALSVLAQDVEGGAWREVPTFAGRPHVEDQGPSPDGFSQILILPPTRALAFRLVLTRDAAHRWAASEIRFDDVEGAGGEP